MNGSVRSYQTKSGEKHEFVLELGIGPDGRRQQVRRRGFPTRQAAVDAMQAELTDRRRGQFIEPDRTPLRDYLDQWLAATAPSRSHATTRHHRDNCKRLDKIGHLPLGRIQPQQLQAAVNQLAATYAPSTVRQTARTLSTALKQAVEWNLLPRNPAANLRLPRIPTARERPAKTWGAAEASLFLASTADSPWHPLWRLLMDALLRLGEALALKWSDLDLATGSLAVRRSVTRDANEHYIIGETAKTASSTRTMSLAPATVAALRVHRAAQLERRLALGPIWQDHDLVFPRDGGTLMNPVSVANAMRGAVAAAGLPTVTPHGLRHTGASLLVLAGVPLVIVSRRLGHASINITADTYVTVDEEADRTAAETLARLLEG